MLKQRISLCCLVLTLLYLSQTYADKDNVNKSCIKTPKINYLADYTTASKTIKVCLRVADSKAIIDDDGRIYLSYRVPLKKGEDPNELCGCMRAYFFQGDWWIGAKNFCYVECDTVTLLLIGTPEKRFINAKPVYEGKDPIDSVIEVFEIYSNAQVWDDKCLAKAGISNDGRKNIVWTCEYSGPNLPPQDVLCNYMYAYISGNNGNDFLGNTTTHTCSVEGDKFYLNLVANEKKT